MREGLRRAVRRLPERGPLLALVLFVAVAAVAVQRRGIVWGDDWALYLRQAKALFDGNIGDVIADNHFNVDNAAKPGFSPYVYPWGFPLLLAPVVRAVGLDYDRLKWIEVAALCAFVWCFHEVVRRRMPKWPALGVVAAVGTTLAYLRHTDFLLSELPYMASAAATLWYLDHLRRGRALHAATHRQLVALGLAAVWVFNVRREGVAMIAAIAVAALIDLWPQRRRWDRPMLRRAATPFAAFALGVIGFQLLLPSALAPEYEDAGLHHTWAKITGPFTRTFAAQLGFESWHGAVLWLVLLLALAGLAVRLWRAARLDAPVAVFAIGSLAVVGMIPANSDRYLLAVTPFAVYFAAQALAAIPLPRSAGPWLAAAVLAAVTVVHLTQVPSAMREASDFNAAGKVLDGPEQPYAQAGMAAVRRYTHEDDVVAFFKARAMTFLTGRRAVQSSELEVVRLRADFFLMRRNSTYSQPLVGSVDAELMGWSKVWEDESWVLWRLPRYERR